MLFGMAIGRTEEYLGMWTRLTALYDEGRTKDALDVIDDIDRRFPERRPYMSNPRACLYSLMGDADRALRVARDAVERGWWWSEARIADPDMDHVRDHPEFRALMQDMAELRERARNRIARTPDVAIFTPDISPARAVVVALHMYGATAEETAPFWSTATSWGAVVAVPESTLRDAGGSPCWDDEGLTDRDVDIALDEARRAHPADHSPVVVGGASQGAAQAVRLAATGRVPGCGAFIAVVGAGPLLAKEPARELRGVFIAGADDVLVRRRQEALHTEFVRRGVESRLEVVPGLGHWYPDDFAARLVRALDFVTAQPPE
jgi:predicted esterase